VKQRRLLRNLTARSRISMTWSSPRVIPTTTQTTLCSQERATHVPVARRTLSTFMVRRLSTHHGASCHSETHLRESLVLVKVSVRCSLSSTQSSWPVTIRWDRRALRTQSDALNQTSLRVTQRTVPQRESTCHKQLRMVVPVSPWTASTQMKDQEALVPAKCRLALWPADVRNEEN